MGIFPKDNIKEYNNQLETILEDKNFSNETKSLLLSMLYKIETAYEDYHMVKRTDETKEEFIQEVLRIIETECEEIETVTPKTEKSRELERVGKNSIVDAPLGKIMVYGSEKDILYSIFSLDTKFNQYLNNKQYEFNNIEKEKLLKFYAIQEILAEGKAMNKAEVIRDFNGWSWNTSKKGLDNIDINLIYQNIIMLLGYKSEKKLFEKGKVKKNTSPVLYSANARNLREINIISEEYEDSQETYDNIDEDSEKYIEKSANVIEDAFSDLYSKQESQMLVDDLNVMILAIYAKQNEEACEDITKIVKYINKRIDLMKDNKEFIYEIAKEKKEINENIKKIDKTLNNRKLLEKEYNKRNKKLANEDKIFSISHLAKILEHEKDEYIKELKRDNMISGPASYEIEKEKILKEKEFYDKVLEATKNNNVAFDLLKKIQLEFLECFKIKIGKTNNRNDLLKLLYRFRYYCVLPINELQEIRDIEELQDGIESTINLLIDKCIDAKIIENISNSVSLCYNLIGHIFETKTIDLEKIFIKVVKNEEKVVGNETNARHKEKLYTITVKYYDNKTVEIDEYTLKVNNLLLLNIRLNRKVQLFI